MSIRHPGEQRLAAVSARTAPIVAEQVASIAERLAGEAPLAGPDLCRVIARVCAIHRHEPPRVNRRLVLVCAADHGTGTGKEPTNGVWAGAQVMTFLSGEGALNRTARSVGVSVRLVDVGVAGDLPDHPGLIRRKVAWGSAPLHRGVAMGRSQAIEALLAGYDGLAEYHASRAVDLVAIGQMSGDTSISCALLTAGLLRMDRKELTEVMGPLEPAMARVFDKHLERSVSLGPLELLASAGGFDIAAMAGAYLAAARSRVAAVAGGFASLVAAAVATSLCPAVQGYVFPSHRSAHPMHERLLQHMGADVLLGFPLAGDESVGATLGLGVLATAASMWAGGDEESTG